MLKMKATEIEAEISQSKKVDMADQKEAEISLPLVSLEELKTDVSVKEVEITEPDSLLVVSQKPKEVEIIEHNPLLPLGSQKLKESEIIEHDPLLPSTNWVPAIQKLMPMDTELRYWIEKADITPNALTMVPPLQTLDKMPDERTVMKKFTLADYNIGHGSTIHLVLSLKGGMDVNHNAAAARIVGGVRRRAPSRRPRREGAVQVQVPPPPPPTKPKPSKLELEAHTLEMKHLQQK